MEIIISLFYGLSLLYIFLFSLGQLHLACIYIRTKKHQTEEVIKPMEVYPHVTVQLPIYNEKYVVERLIDAISKFQYPKERLEIQLLDDSTDETTEIILKKIDAIRSLNLNVKLIHRTNRVGFKAGGGGVARVVSNAKKGAHAQRPEFMESAVQDAEGGVVGSCNGNAQVFRYLHSRQPGKDAMFGHHRRNHKPFDF